MKSFLGIDTSNYTTSAAIYEPSSGIIRQRKKLLPVKDGEKGIRQSDAVFHHTRQLPETAKELLESSNSDIRAVGVSVRPRNVEGSYMPCFLAGETAGELISSALGVKLYKTSHQVGHILAALYSSGRLDLLKSEKSFIAFHVSGGTTDCLICAPDKDEALTCREIASSSDLKAGQAIDRVGVTLGLKFPCGKELEELAIRSERKFRISPHIKDGCCSFSGLENICKKMLSDGEKKEDIALYCIKYIEAAIIKTTEWALKEYGELPIVYAGGVMSDRIIRESVAGRFEAYFADPEFSSDNAAGIAIYAAIREGEVL